ncbi:MAG: hypothetical protein ABIR38_06700 [Chthoniobacterales bacterium]
MASLVVSALAESPPEYPAVEAAKHVGETVTVTDKVERAYQAKGGNIFLNMGGAHPNEVFTIFVATSAAEKFADFKKHEGATVSLTGKVTSHNEKPEISVSSPDEITLKDAAPALSETPTPTPPVG